jgi:hypothetical protein
MNRREEIIREAAAAELRWLHGELYYKQQAEPVPALTRYNEIVAEDPDDDMGGPLERLRFFCSLSMPTQDWLDSEPFFDALKQAEPVVERSIGVNALLKMVEPLEGINREQRGYAYRQGWNAAIRQAMDYAQPHQAEPGADSGNASF